MKHIVTPLAEVDIAVGIAVDAIAMLLLLRGFANVSRVIEIFEGDDTLTESFAAVREILADELLNEVFAIRRQHVY